MLHSQDPCSLCFGRRKQMIAHHGTGLKLFKDRSLVLGKRKKKCSSPLVKLINAGS